MKIKSLLLGILACGVLVACSNNDIVEDNDSVIQPKGEAYMSVKLSMAGAFSRATSEGYDEGTADESAVSSALFLFYDKDGNYVTSSTPATQFNEIGENISHQSDILLILDKVEVKPVYVVALLNTPEGINVKNKSMQALLKQINTDTELDGYATDFFMTNSVYLDNNAKIINATNIAGYIKDKKEDAMENPVQIYVERVAAKATLKLKTDLNLPEVNVILDNNEVTLTVNIKGLGLSGTNKTSHIVKNIDANWNFKWEWNKTADFRSFWAKDGNYTDGRYFANDADYDENKDAASLNYVSWNDLAQQQPPVTQYCLENTMDVSLISDAEGATIPYTEMLLAAEIVVKKSDGTTEPAKDLFKRNGVFYTLDSYKASALNDIKTLNYLKKISETEFESIDVSDIDIKSIGDGRVSPAMVTGFDYDNIYKKTGEGSTATDYTKQDATEVENAIKETLNTQELVAEGYKDGACYYDVAIEHLSSDKKETGAIGIVRNHTYQLTVNKIVNLGNAVYDKDHEIIHTVPGPHKEYYVAAQLNILSWNTLSQGVEF